MLNISVCTLNVHGLRDSTKCKNVITWLNVFAFDFVLLQETHLRNSDFDNFKRRWNGQVFFSSAPSNHSSGVAIACSKRINCSFSQVREDNEGRFISVLGDIFIK